ncbi:hypothetical protein BCR34DRAFT_659893 [Clohesyomyces aquaticus]|uniref:TLC domain-domain-containing protein n=1 Tax=Clohesyomyces aquaticus TaxID=1231657 RepID=A0A1Y2A9U5_9PLEO|nr:hypothetical protein BCR34DRAFT_659893 [Clohesyomyces aquaticus]
MASHHHHRIMKHPHIAELKNQNVSELAQFAGLPLTITLIVMFLIRYYACEKFLMKKLYGIIYKRLKENRDRQGFVNHHIAAFAKIIMVVSACVPYFKIMFGRSELDSPYFGSKIVTMGDVLLVVNQIFIAMLIFELIYRESPSYIAVAHHIGAAIIAQIAVVLSIQWRHQGDATVEFMLCLTWGAFDVLLEFYPHVSIILYRIYPTRHHFLKRVFLAACVLSLCSTVLETALVMYLFGILWHRWSLSLKVITPILHVLFTYAQLLGAKNHYEMWKRQKNILLEEKTKDEEAASGVIEVGSVGQKGGVGVSGEEVPP